MVKHASWLSVGRAGPLVMLLLLGFADVVAAQGVVYRVAAAGQADSYLVGTMHSDDRRVRGLVAGLGPLIEKVDTVALELVPDGVTLLAVGAATLLPGDTRLRDVVGEQRFLRLARAADAADLPVAVLDRLRPWAAAVTLGLPASDSGRFLDLEIYQHALALQRRTVGLETAAEQLGVFQGMPLALQIGLLDETIKNADRMPTQLEELTQAYLRGDLQGLERLALDQYADMPTALVTWLDERLLRQRNARMLERLRPLLADGSVLVAVGALHLGGETGLVSGLRRHGYRVSRLSADGD